MPQVNPSTGGIKWKTETEGGFNIIATDAETVWAYFQEHVLFPLSELAGKDGNINMANQPFFDRVEIDISISAPEERLGVREEMLSVADALHEDIYFVGLDMFKRFGEREGIKLRAPGSIVPNIRVREGAPPVFRFRIIPKSGRALVNTPKLIAIEIGASEVFGAQFQWEVPTEEEATRISSLLGGVGSEDAFPINITFTFPSGTKSCRTGYVATDELFSDLPKKGIVYQDELQKITSNMRKRGQFIVEQTGVSCEGRAIYSVCATSSTAGLIRSAAKLTALKPTYLMNNRHHANEVSSTGAAVEILDNLQTDVEFAKLLKRVNVVVIPSENVDGAALHKELSKENPTHKLHAARFNARGKEFGEAYFLDDLATPEAQVLPYLWKKWVPDIVVDNHGIPAQEWTQPFSGYLCPWYASFWIPRSLFYAYFWYVDDEGSPSESVAKALERVITISLVNDREIYSRNLDLLDRW
ncbi:MAG: M14 family metallopeptidase, partial [bacterium]|nr:M14 family metallopeptidase [bacterium]